MFEVVKSKLAPSKGPISGVVKKGPLVMCAQIPKHPTTGALIQGDITVQTRRVIENLKLAMEGAGGSLADVMMIQVYLINASDITGMNEVWAELLREPYPSRATVVVKELLLPGMLIEIVATAHLGPA
jgi:2-iminobutanoate/2-iminopropanoate deaminase